MAEYPASGVPGWGSLLKEYIDGRTDHKAIAGVMSNLPNVQDAVAGAAPAAVAKAIYITRTTKNLFNPADPDILTDRVPASASTGGAGNYVTLANYSTSGFIPVIGGQTYTSHLFRYYEWYTAAKVSLGLATTLANNAQTVQITAPATAAFVRVTWHRTASPKPQIERGVEFTGYEDYFAGEIRSVDPQFAALVLEGLKNGRPLTVVKAGNVVSIARAHEGKVLTENVNLANSQAGANGFNFQSTTLDALSFHSTTDDICPIRTTSPQAGTWGGNHGGVSEVANSLWIDGKRISEDGTYTGTTVEVRESYLVVNNRMENVYSWTASRCRVSMAMAELVPTALGLCGGVQSARLSASGYTVKRYLFGVGVVDGKDWSAGVVLDDTFAPRNLTTTAALKVAGRPPLFSLDVLLDGGGNPVVGFVMGYLPHGVRGGEDSTMENRIARSAATLWETRHESAKNYPAFVTSRAAGWGTVRVEAFRAYVTPAEISALLGAGADAYGAWLALDAQRRIS